MRFIIIRKADADTEARKAPTHELAVAMMAYNDEMAKAGILLGGDGLRPTADGFRVRFADGKPTVIDGPFTEAKELVGGFALMRVRSKEEAISWCDKFAAVLGDVELFMGPVVEPWDLGMMPKPKNPPLRFLSLQQVNEKSKDEAPPDPEHMAKMGALIDEMKKAGVLQATGGLAGTKKGARIRYDGGKPTVIDGPFAESKELIAGYAIVDLPSKAAAIEWALRFGDVVKVNEIDVRQMPES